jgi:hypothetical protein
MRTRPIVLFVGFLSSLAPAGPVRGGIVTYTDLDEWRAAAAGVGTGVVTEIDFATLPNGLPTPFEERVLITPEFNYTEQGVTFSTPVPELRVWDCAICDGGVLDAQDVILGSSGRNWIIAHFVEPAAAVGIVSGGHTTLSLYDDEGTLIAEALLTGGGTGLFVGIVSDIPIASGAVDRGASFEILDSFHFTPVPEPATLLLLGAGEIALMARKARKG